MYITQMGMDNTPMDKIKMDSIQMDIMDSNQIL